MVGLGPSQKSLASRQSECSHTIFVFDDNDIVKVMDAYGNLLLDTFSDEELRQRECTAVGMVHRQHADDDASKYCPHRVGDYWDSYNPRLTGIDPTPQT